MPGTKTPITEQSTLRVLLGVVVSVIFATLSLGVPCYLLIVARDAPPVLLAAVVAVFAAGAVVGRWVGLQAVAELRRRRDAQHQR